MNFLAPLAFALAVLLPAIIALYFLKLRRQEQRVSSIYLWQTLVRDAAANTPWQRLRPNLLLLLQLLFLTVLILALARPFTWSSAAAGSHLILVVDTSASMGATDVQPQRLAAAVAAAQQLIETLPGSAQITLIEAGAQVRVPVSGTRDANAARAALAALRPGLGGADFTSALTLAAALAAREPESEVVILSDGRITVPENLTLPGRVRYIPIGSASDNQAIGAFSVHAEVGGRDLTAFVQVANYGPRQVQRRLVLRGDNGQLITARDLSLAPNDVQAITIPALPPQEHGFEALLEGQDMLAGDDRAWSAGAATGKVNVQLVSAGNRFLESALRLLPNVQVTLTQPNEYKGAPAEGITILDSVVPTTTLPTGDLLIIAPPRSTAAFSVTGRIEAPLPVPLVADDPLLRYVDLRDVAIQEAAQLALPAWGRAAIIDGKTSAPLLVVGEQDGRRLAVLAFDLRRSDLPLRVAFPLLLANLVDTLAPGRASGALANGEPGKPLAILAPSQAEALAVGLPDGRAVKLVPSAGRATLPAADQLGIYDVAWQDREGKSHSLGRFAVNLFQAQESDIAPRPSLPVAGAGSAGAQELPRAHNEWWRPIAWAALALLVTEWLVAYRGQVVRVFSAGVRRWRQVVGEKR